MFTGIIEELGTVAEMNGNAGGVTLRVDAPVLARLAQLGDSISVSGCCLTVVQIEGSELAFEAVPETLSRTSLGTLAAGDRVNLEDALRAGEPFGGHMVQGHVDGVGQLRSRRADGIGERLGFSAPEHVQRYVIEKGSITIAGISLTVATLEDDGFEIALIPHTLAVTTLGTLALGDSVNLEADAIARYVERLLSARSSVS